MKIRLERNLTHSPDQLPCAVCRHPFPVTQIRLLLFADRGLLRGDVCPDCFKLGSDGIRQTMLDRAILLQMQSKFSRQCNTIAVHQLATELMDCARENVQFPTFWHWCFKWWEVWRVEAVALETARLNLSRCCDRQTVVGKRLQVHAGFCLDQKYRKNAPLDN